MPIVSLVLPFLALALPDLHATVECPKVAAPGRVRCELVETVDTSGAITWGDALVLSAPPSVVALKGRLGPGDATAKDAHAWRFGFALVVRTAGETDVALRARAVVCDAAQVRCLPREVDLVAHLSVGK